MPNVLEIGIDPTPLLAKWDAIDTLPICTGNGIDTTVLNKISMELQPLAQGIDWAGTVMRERRFVSERIDPWRCGLLLAILCQPIYEKDDNVVSRWQVFQAAGYWQDREFVEWANEFTGVRDKTWMGWRHVADVYLLRPVGRAYIEKHLGMTLQEFVEATSIDKALRACATVARGQLQTHQLEALVDETVTSERMRHAMRVDEDDWKEHLDAIEEREEDWVSLGESEPMLEYDPAQRVVRLRYIVIDTGEVKTFTVFRLPVPGHELVEEKQREVLNWLGL